MGCEEVLEVFSIIAMNTLVGDEGSCVMHFVDNGESEKFAENLGDKFFSGNF